MCERFESFAASIAEVYRYIQKIKRAEMKALGLKGNHTMCLYYLGRNPGGLTPTQLSKYCREDKAAVSRTLGELEALELIARPRPEDGKRDYRNRYSLTPQGEEVVDKIDQRIDAALEAGGRGLTDEQRASFYSALEIIRCNLKELTVGGDTTCR